MTIYSFWIFDKHCNCIFDKEWTIPSQPRSGTTNSKQNENVAKLLYGLIFSLRSITDKISSDPVDFLSQKNRIRSITTGKCRVHLFETATGFWFALMTDFKQDDYYDILNHIYKNIFVRFISLNYISPSDFVENEDEKGGQGIRKINNKNFINNLELFLSPLIS
ncbi:hypothetical protein KAFR_0I00270 [Kazachstania africana CBS 2517]|uniref:Trafficking protein particle complex subunit n=1 Tax=Kazachstania africana (strain ATCC 22294 / BCRC 22015 / CBS 2517 / CECT 1963 / NBRC 1671 / NRRL Y-8276) TaxID=1071382 RepID=H2AZK8_KAZAF|nr:hypothetical protein KAFR_0I00270 [Kazachstania africana CBS 2517]CCF59808.1 hypothetical protein KAFR_0I00270 [Kazachstania africana CBS 2517]